MSVFLVAASILVSRPDIDITGARKWGENNKSSTFVNFVSLFVQSACQFSSSSSFARI